jgi:hypothetical protein
MRCKAARRPLWFGARSAVLLLVRERRTRREFVLVMQNRAEPPAHLGSGPASPGSAHESARFIATISLTLGALMLSLFGIIERMVTFEKLTAVNEFALLALLPGIATLGFLACARAISWMISNLRFEQWHAVVP